MPSTCDQRNPLGRSGTTQDGRRAKALDPVRAPIDDRSLADLLVFAQRYSRHLRFYDAGNERDGDWLPFFSQDESAVLSLLQGLPGTSFGRFSRSLRSWLVADENRDEAQLRNHFKLLFHLGPLLLREAGEHFDRLSDGHALRAFMVKSMERDAAGPLHDLVAFAKGARDVGLFDDTTPLNVAHYNTTFDDADARLRLPGSVTRRLDEMTVLPTLDVSEQLLAPPWTTLYASVPADTNPYPGGSVAKQIRDALGYAPLTRSIERLFQVIERVTRQAGQGLAASIESGEHAPHYGLWLTFLRLFAENQAHLNTLTARHLDFYYRDVLRLAPRPAEPNRVHLLFELSRNVLDHRLAGASTRFKGGKDDAGHAVAYELDDDFVANRGQVLERRGVRRAIVELGGGVKGVQPLASRVADSRDGQGAQLTDDAPGWSAFGPLPGAPPARIGFAIADRRLFLREGDRSIFIDVVLDQAPSFSSRPDPGAFKALLTGEEAWFEAEASFEVDPYDPARCRITIALDGEDPAVVPYDELVHGETETLAVNEPVVRVELDLDVTTAAGRYGAAAYAELSAAGASSIEVSVHVENVRNFTVQNDQGAIDTAKPFHPFGPAPERGSSLILGSSELFSKRLESLTLTIGWNEALCRGGSMRTNPSAHRTAMRHLAGSGWRDLGPSEGVALFGQDPGPYSIWWPIGTAVPGPPPVTVPLAGLADLAISTAQTMANEPYTRTSRTGFIRFDLPQGFGHSAYAGQMTMALINVARDPSYAYSSPFYNANGGVPATPYTPKIDEISLSYATSSSAPARFFHLHPFGHVETEVSSGLLPLLANQGELLIGVADLQPPQRLALLFQTVDGSANPLKNETAVTWSYLRGDEWIDLVSADVDDRTRNLTGSGVVGLAVPESADTAHTLPPSGLHWIRMSVASDADGLNDLLSVDAQAASATFVDQGNDPDFTASPLAAGTISRLQVSDTAIKKVAQPYESFGGRPPESDEAFRVRVSERLRHKDRASTMWDYERLVLEAFPNVYRVKCVNHTELCRDVENEILADNEMKPGHVLVVPLPYVSQDGAVDPLRPYTDKRTLVAIDAFLRERVSPFVRLEVQNPKVEAVQVKFKVAFAEGLADIGFHLGELNRAIVRYLTPWSYDEGAEISFGGSWHKSAVIDFIEEQPSVDWLKDFEMYHQADITRPDWTRVDVEVARATTARSILVSHPSHVIEEVS